MNVFCYDSSFSYLFYLFDWELNYCEDQFIYRILYTTYQHMFCFPFWLSGWLLGLFFYIFIFFLIFFLVSEKPLWCLGSYIETTWICCSQKNKVTVAEATFKAIIHPEWASMILSYMCWICCCIFSFDLIWFFIISPLFRYLCHFLLHRATIIPWHLASCR